MTAVIIPAGGSGKRLGAPIPKQFLTLAGRPLILWTIERFVTIEEIKLIIIPVIWEWAPTLEKFLQEAHFPTPITVVPGGQTRQESVWSGLRALPTETEVVLVHDAARPLVSETVIRDVIKAVKHYGAAIAATSVRDTVKQEKGGFVEKTLPREHIYLAQTPQGAYKNLLLKAFEEAHHRGYLATDEAGLLEYVGVPVRLVSSPPSNFKVTTKEDLKLADLILRNSRPTTREPTRPREGSSI